MGCFSFCLNGLCLLGQGAIQLNFVGRLTGRRQRVWHFVVYLSLICAIEFLSGRFALGETLSVAAGVLALYLVSRAALGNRRSASWVAAVLAFYISQLSFGILNSVESVILPRRIGTPLLYPLLLAALAVLFAICGGCCAAVCRLLSLSEDSRTPDIGLLLLPGLFYFAVELYILRTSYRFSASNLSPVEVGKHSLLLLLQAAGLAALLCTLYAYRHLCRGFRAQAALQSLTQAVQAQKVFLAEAQARCQRTRAFRHDIKNHLSVLDGLLKKGQPEEGIAYLEKLETFSDSLSFPFQTGNPVVDILLGEKLGTAEGIAAEVSLVLPDPCGVDDLDLCVIFANALDNATAACRAAEGPGSIRITGKRQGELYLLEFENSCPEGPLPPAGTGLSNIRAVAEKYRGAVLTEKTGRRFSLSVLLDIS